MTARTSMADLIARLRRMTGAVGNSAAAFTDLEVQDFLDERRTDVLHYPLSAQTDIVNGAIVWKTFAADRPWWEDDTALSDLRGVALTPDTPDPLSGRWSFDESVNPPAVFASGRFFDLYGSAVSLLQAWQGLVARDFDVMTDAETWTRSQKARGLADLAASYQRRVAR